MSTVANFVALKGRQWYNQLDMQLLQLARFKEPQDIVNNLDDVNVILARRNFGDYWTEWLHSEAIDEPKNGPWKHRIADYIVITEPYEVAEFYRQRKSTATEHDYFVHRPAMFEQLSKIAQLPQMSPEMVARLRSVTLSKI